MRRGEGSRNSEEEELLGRSGNALSPPTLAFLKVQLWTMSPLPLKRVFVRAKRPRFISPRRVPFHSRFVRKRDALPIPMPPTFPPGNCDREID